MLSVERNNILFSALSTSTGNAENTRTAIVPDSAFASSLAVQVSALEAQSINLLLNSATTSRGATTANGSLFDLLASVSTLSGSNTSVSGLSATGRNLSLFDPESAYRMMTEINRRDAVYKAQSSELSEMKTAIATLGQAGKQLSDALSGTADKDTVRTQVQAFVAKYNDWIRQFEPTVETGGLLDGTQAAETTLYEFEQSIENPFNGAALGLNGLKDLGISIDSTTHLATLNETQFDAMLTSSRAASLGTLKDFSGSFSRTAELLDSNDSFIAHRLANLEHAINYIDENTASLQAEFGRGDPATLSKTTSAASVA